MRTCPWSGLLRALKPLPPAPRTAQRTPAVGFEDERAWCLVDGGRRLVIDDVYSCQLTGRSSTLVAKKTGEVSSLNYLEDPERFNAMTEVGHHPPEDSFG